jgi:hypothetical protein
LDITVSSNFDFTVPVEGYNTSMFGYD